MITNYYINIILNRVWASNLINFIFFPNIIIQIISNIGPTYGFGWAYSLTFIDLREMIV